MAQRRRRKKSSSGVSPVMAMLFGLAVGLSVAAAVYMKDRRPAPQAARPEPASMQGALDNNAEDVATEAAPAETNTDDKEVRRFTFYDILPNFEVVTPEEEPVAAATTVPQAIVEPGLYVLQAGSFSTQAVSIPS